MNYAIFRSKPINTLNDLAQIGSHNKRDKKAYNSNPDIKLELSKNNIELVPLTEKYVKGFKILVKDYEKEHNERMKTERPDRKKTFNQMLDGSRNVVADELLFTATNGFFKGMSRDEIKEWGNTCIEFVYNDLGYKKEQILHATIHLDEATPHLHCVVVPLVKKFDKRTNTERYTISKKQYIKDRIHLSQLQDKYHQRLVDKGYKLERGIKGSDAVHQNVKELKKTTRYYEKKAETINDSLNNAIQDFDEKMKTTKNTILDKEYLKVKKDTFESMNNVIKESKKVIEFQPKMEQLFNEVDSFSKSHQALEKENKNLEREVKSLKTRNSNLLEDNKSLKNIIKELFQRLKEFLREILQFGNENAKDSATYEVKYNYDIDNFSSDDVYDIAVNTSKENELFSYVGMPDYMKSTNKPYNIDNDKYNMMITLSKQICDDIPNEKQYIKILDNLEKKKVFTRTERNLCLKPIFRYSKSEVENALRRLNRQAEKEAEEFYNMDKKHDDYDMSL